MIDIVFPSKNENEFIEMAKRIGITGLIFAYKNKTEFYTKESPVPITNALLVEPKDMQKARAISAQAICLASREAIERGADIAYGFELQEAKDPTHYRASGLNQVLCKLATEKKVRIGISFSTILAYTGQKRATTLGRIMQNIIFCRKYKTPIKIASFATNPYEMRAPAELAAFFQQLGIHPKEIQTALK